MRHLVLYLSVTHVACSAGPLSPALGQPVKVTAGATHSCALSLAGDVFCWGDNQYGQVGTLGDNVVMFPRRVRYSGRFKSVSAGGLSTCGTDTAGIAICWGLSVFLLPPTADHGDAAPPTRVPSSPVFAHISLGFAHACGVSDAGIVFCWGANGHSEVGPPTEAPVYRPQVVTGLPGVQSIDAGERYTCVVSTEGEVWCWGMLVRGGVVVWPPRKVTIPGVVRAVTVGDGHACAVTGDSFSWCWGGNGAGQLGVSTTLMTHEPTRAEGTPLLGLVRAGRHFTCGLSDAHDQVWCWGLNSLGELGDGSRNSRSDAAPVILDDAASDLAVGGFHACAVLRGGDIACWGDNSLGQLGNTSRGSSALPVRVAGM